MTSFAVPPAGPWNEIRLDASGRPDDIVIDAMHCERLGNDGWWLGIYRDMARTTFHITAGTPVQIQLLENGLHTKLLGHGPSGDQTLAAGGNQATAVAQEELISQVMQETPHEGCNFDLSPTVRGFVCRCDWKERVAKELAQCLGRLRRRDARPRR